MVPLRYLAGEEESSIEVMSKATLVDEDKDLQQEMKELTAIEEKEGEYKDYSDDDDDKIISELDLGFIDDVANIVANITMKNIDGYNELSEEYQRFIFEEVAESITRGLETADFSVASFEIWDALGRPVASCRFPAWKS